MGKSEAFCGDMSVPGLGHRLQREQQELSLRLCRVIGDTGAARPAAAGADQPWAAA